MNCKKVSLVTLIIFFLFPISNISAFTHVDYIKDGNYLFFLFDLEEGNSTEINLIHEESGNFTLFLFNKRPLESYIKNDKTLNQKIFSNPALVNYSIDNNPYINYTAPETNVYYIEIILVSGGPDTFTFTCNKDLTRYYLPIIPGFQIEFIIFALIFSIGLSIIVYKKRKNIA